MTEIKFYEVMVLSTDDICYPRLAMSESHVNKSEAHLLSI
jgi:hypothetical protein